MDLIADEALEVPDDDYTIGVVEKLVSLPSVSGEEAAISDWTASELQRLGLEVVEQEVAPGRRNVIATLTGAKAGPTLLFNGHLDTLPVPAGWTRDPYSPERIDGRLYGAEITNMKAAIGAMIGCIEFLRRRQDEIAGRIVLSAVVGECDALGLGTTHMLQAGLVADAAINGEPTDLNVMTAHSGVTQLRLRFKGRSVHVCRREDGHNAVNDLLQALAALDETALAFEPHPEFPGLPTLNIGVVRGGRMASMLADEAEALVDVRTVPGMTPETVRADIQRAVQRTLAGIGLSNGVAVDLLTPPAFCQQYPYHVERDAPLVRMLATAHRSVRGAEPHIGSMQPQIFYGTDASHLMRAGIPTVIYGPGKAVDINTADESMDIRDFLDAAKTYLLSALAFCRPA